MMEGMVHTSDVSETSSAPETLIELLQERGTSVNRVAPVRELQDLFQSALVVSEQAERHTNEGRKRKKIQDHKTYQSERLASRDMKAHISKNRSQISNKGLGKRHEMKFSKFKKKFSKVHIHNVTYSGVTIQITEYLPGKDLNHHTAKTKENMKLKGIFRALCTQIMKSNKDGVFNFTIVDIMSASFRKCQPSITFFDEQNSVGPLQLKSHIQDFREEIMNIWNSKKIDIIKSDQFLYKLPHSAILEYPLPKVDYVFPSLISCLYCSHSEIMDIEKKMTDCLSIKSISENCGFDQLKNKNDNLFKDKHCNDEEFDESFIQLDSNICNNRATANNGCSNVKTINPKIDGSLLNIGKDSQQSLNIQEAPSKISYKNKFKNDIGLLGYENDKEILKYPKNYNSLKKYYKNVHSELGTNEYSNIISDKDVIPTEVSDFVLEFDKGKDCPETKITENDVKSNKNARKTLDDYSDKEIFSAIEIDNFDMYDKHMYSKLHDNEYSTIIDDGYESPMEESELVFLDLDNETKNSEIKLNETGYSSDIDSVNNKSTHDNSLQLCGMFNNCSEFVSCSTNILDGNESLQDQNEISRCFNKRQKLNVENVTKNFINKCDVAIKSHYHCFLMEAENEATSGVYDPVTESWREEQSKEDSFDENCKQRNFKYKRTNMQNKRLNKHNYCNGNLAKVMLNLIQKMEKDNGDADKEKSTKIEQERLELTLEVLGLISTSQFVSRFLEKRLLTTRYE